MPGVQSLVIVAGMELNRVLQGFKKGISGLGSWDHRIIPVGRVTCGLFRPSPAQSQASFEVRSGCSGLDPAGAWKPPGMDCTASACLSCLVGEHGGKRETWQMCFHFRKTLMSLKAEGFPVVKIPCSLQACLSLVLLQDSGCNVVWHERDCLSTEK